MYSTSLCQAGEESIWRKWNSWHYKLYWLWLWVEDQVYHNTAPILCSGRLSIELSFQSYEANYALSQRINEVKSSSIGDCSSFQLAASWQANKNFLLKVSEALCLSFRWLYFSWLWVFSLVQGKLGPLTSSVALAFKSWWRPSFTFSITGYWLFL